MEKKSTGARIFHTGNAEDAVNVRYRTGFWAPDPFVAAEGADGKMRMFLGALERGRAETACPGAEFPEGRVEEWCEREGVRLVEVSEGCAAGLVERLRAKGIKVAVGRGADTRRAVKREDEIGEIRKAQAAAVAAVRRAAAVLRESEEGQGGILRWKGARLTSERLRKEMEAVLMERGCGSEEGMIVAGGRQAAFPHEEGHGALRAGEAIVLDVFPRRKRSGYWGDLTRTLMKGEAKDPRVAAMWKAVAEAQRTAFAMLRPGVTGAEVHKAVEAHFEAAGFPARWTPGKERGFIHGLGHGVGLEIHEEPRLNRKGGMLEEGMVVTVEPGLYDPAIGGVRIEDTVVLRRGGFEFLRDMPRRMRV